MSICLRPMHFAVSAIVVTWMFAPRPTRAQDYSAYMIQTDQDGTTDTSRVYSKAGLLRIDNISGGTVTTAAVLDNVHHTVTAFDPVARRYGTLSMTNYLTARGMSPMQAMLQPTTANPCDYWNALLKSFASARHEQTPPTVSCTDAGAETVDGRAAEHWALTSNASPGTTNVWIDRSLGFVTRMQDRNSEMKFTHLTVATQPDSLFHVPAAYTKWDSSAMPASHVNGKTRSSLGPESGKPTTSTSNGVVGGAGKTLAKDAGKIAAKAARQKADSEMTKKARKIFHIP